VYTYEVVMTMRGCWLTWGTASTAHLTLTVSPLDTL